MSTPTLAALQASLLQVHQELRPLDRRVAEALCALAQTAKDKQKQELVDALVARDQFLGGKQAAAPLQGQEEDSNKNPTGWERGLARFRLARSHALADATLLAELRQLQAQALQQFWGAKARLGKEKLGRNTLSQRFAQAKDSAERQKLWEAWQTLGQEVGETLIELAEKRNQYARSLGHRDYFALSLTLAEFDEERLLATTDHLESATREVASRWRALLDARCADKLGITGETIRPWHHDDIAFRTLAGPDEPALDPIYAHADLPDLATRFMDGLGMNVRPILEPAELFGKPAGETWAMAEVLDRQGPELCLQASLGNDEASMAALLGLLAGGVFQRYVRQPLPLREPAHPLLVHAFKTLLQDQSADADFLMEYLGLEAEVARPVASALVRLRVQRRLLRVRTAILALRFEREFYEDPRRADLNDRWWVLAKETLQLDCPEELRGPAWANLEWLVFDAAGSASILYGELLAPALRQVLLKESDGRSLVDNLAAGEMLLNGLMVPGNSQRWDALVEEFLGESFSVAAFIRELTEE